MKLNNDILRLLVIFPFIFCCLTIVAQDENEIRTSGQYYFATGKGDSYDEAQEKATAAIARQIFSQVSQSVKSSSVTESNNGKVNSTTTTEIKNQAYSSVTLNNVGVIEKAQEPYELFCYVAKSEIDKMFEQRKAKILDLIETGKKAEQRVQLDDALRNYYWAMMLYRTYRGNFDVEIGGLNGDCLKVMKDKITSLVKDIKIKVTDYRKNAAGGISADLEFTYNGFPVSSLCYKYNTGHSFETMGMMDGRQTVAFDALPANKILKLSLEYQFAKEAKNLSPELKNAFDMVKSLDGKLITIPECSINVPIQKEASSAAALAVVPTATGAVANAEPIRMKEKIELKEVRDNAPYKDAMVTVNNAIKNGRSEMAKDCFTPDAYKVFKLLFTNTGNVILNDNQPECKFVDIGYAVLARFSYVTLKQHDGHSFSDKIVFRFDPASKKITSFAFGLTDKAEADILNKNTDWGAEISKHLILAFMEDYKTAFNLKRHDYISTIFSDSAIIVTGTVLTKKAPKLVMTDGKLINIGKNKNVVYKKQNKQQYLRNLERVFAENKYVHIAFEDNTARVLEANNPNFPPGTVFGIQIKQLYASSKYADRGYLTLMLDLGNNPPEIEVRLWQPETEDMVKLNDFFSSKNFPF